MNASMAVVATRTRGSPGAKAGAGFWVRLFFPGVSLYFPSTKITRCPLDLRTLASFSSGVSHQRFRPPTTTTDCGFRNFSKPWSLSRQRSTRTRTCAASWHTVAMLRNRSSVKETDTGGLGSGKDNRSEEHTSELQSRSDLVCRLLLEKKKTIT